MMRAKRPDETWAEYAAATGQEADPVKYPKDPNRSGPGPGDHVSVDHPTPQHDKDTKGKKGTFPPDPTAAQREAAGQMQRAGRLNTAFGPINPPVQEPPQQKPDPRERR